MPLYCFFVFFFFVFAQNLLNNSLSAPLLIFFLHISLVVHLFHLLLYFCLCIFSFYLSYFHFSCIVSFRYSVSILMLHTLLTHLLSFLFPYSEGYLISFLSSTLVVYSRFFIFLPLFLVRYIPGLTRTCLRECQDIYLLLCQKRREEVLSLICRSSV